MGDNQEILKVDFASEDVVVCDTEENALVTSGSQVTPVIKSYDDAKVTLDNAKLSLEALRIANDNAKKAYYDAMMAVDAAKIVLKDLFIDYGMDVEVKNIEMEKILGEASIVYDSAKKAIDEADKKVTETKGILDKTTRELEEANEAYENAQKRKQLAEEEYNLAKIAKDEAKEELDKSEAELGRAMTELNEAVNEVDALYKSYMLAVSVADDKAVDENKGQLIDDILKAEKLRAESGIDKNEADVNDRGLINALIKYDFTLKNVSEISSISFDVKDEIKYVKVMYNLNMENQTSYYTYESPLRGYEGIVLKQASVYEDEDTFEIIEQLDGPCIDENAIIAGNDSYQSILGSSYVEYAKAKYKLVRAYRMYKYATLVAPDDRKDLDGSRTVVTEAETQLENINSMVIDAKNAYDNNVMLEKSIHEQIEVALVSEANLREATSDNDAAKKLVEEAEQKVAELTEKLEIITASYDQLKAEYEAKVESDNNLINEISDLDVKLGSKREISVQAEAEYNEAKSNFDTSLEEAMAADQDYASKNQDYEETLTVLNNTKISVDSKNAEMQELQNSNEVAKEKASKSIADSAAAEMRRDEALRALAEAREAKEQGEEAYSRAGEELENAKTLLEEKTKLNEEASAKYEQVKIIYDQEKEAYNQALVLESASQSALDELHFNKDTRLENLIERINLQRNANERFSGKQLQTGKENILKLLTEFYIVQNGGDNVDFGMYYNVEDAVGKKHVPVTYTDEDGNIKTRYIDWVNEDRNPDRIQVYERDYNVTTTYTRGMLLKHNLMVIHDRNDWTSYMQDGKIVEVDRIKTYDSAISVSDEKNPSKVVNYEKKTGKTVTEVIDNSNLGTGGLYISESYFLDGKDKYQKTKKQYEAKKAEATEAYEKAQQKSSEALVEKNKANAAYMDATANRDRALEEFNLAKSDYEMKSEAFASAKARVEDAESALTVASSNAEASEAEVNNTSNACAIAKQELLESNQLLELKSAEVVSETDRLAAYEQQLNEKAQAKDEAFEKKNQMADNKIESERVSSEKRINLETISNEIVELENSLNQLKLTHATCEEELVYCKENLDEALESKNNISGELTQANDELANNRAKLLETEQKLLEAEQNMGAESSESLTQLYNEYMASSENLKDDLDKKLLEQNECEERLNVAREELEKKDAMLANLLEIGENSENEYVSLCDDNEAADENYHLKLNETRQLAKDLETAENNKEEISKEYDRLKGIDSEKQAAYEKAKDFVLSKEEAVKEASIEEQKSLELRNKAISNKEDAERKLENSRKMVAINREKAIESVTAETVQEVAVSNNSYDEVELEVEAEEPVETIRPVEAEPVKTIRPVEVETPVKTEPQVEVKAPIETKERPVETVRKYRSFVQEKPKKRNWLSDVVSVLGAATGANKSDRFKSLTKKRK